jgi:hypothetical protein
MKSSASSGETLVQGFRMPPGQAKVYRAGRWAHAEIRGMVSIGLSAVMIDGVFERSGHRFA